MVKILGYVGSAFMLGFSFSLVIPFAIIGLTLLTIQTINLKAHNLTAVNIVSIVGFIYQMLK